MSLWSRAINLFRGERVNREIEEELATHMTEGIAEGRDPSQIRNALGPALQIREESRDLRIIPWLDSLARAHCRAGRIFLSHSFRRGTFCGHIRSLVESADGLLFGPSPDSQRGPIALSTG